MRELLRLFVQNVRLRWADRKDRRPLLGDDLIDELKAMLRGECRVFEG